MITKKVIAFILIMTISIICVACRANAQNSPGLESDRLTLDLFAPDDSLEPIITIVHNYGSFNSDVDIRITFDTGDMLTAKVEAGYECDVFFADHFRYMDWLDASAPSDANPNKNDCLISESRSKVMVGPKLTEDGIENSNPLTYEIAVVKNSKYQEESQKFLEYLMGEAGDEVFEMYGYTPL